MTKVLIVEDEPSTLELIASYLQDAGFQVVSVNNAKSALEQTASEKPDLVITDMVMPGMSGLEFCRSLKKNPETQQIPVMACTSKNQDLDRVWAKKQGVALYLTKPFTREEILQAVRSLV